MITKELMDKINKLANKKKTIGLTKEELVEQKKLREEYLVLFRKRMTAHLNRIKIVD